MFCVYCINYYVNKFEARSLFSTSHYIRKDLRKYCNFLFYDDLRIMGLTYKNIIDFSYFLMFIYLTNGMIMLIFMLNSLYKENICNIII